MSLEKREIGSGPFGVCEEEFGIKLRPSERRSDSLGRSLWEDKFWMNFLVKLFRSLYNIALRVFLLEVLRCGKSLRKVGGWYFLLRSVSWM